MKNEKTHIICYSGGHSSALVAVEVVRKFGKENVILLNHGINPKYELPDIKRFKDEVADYLKLKITYANYNDLPESEIPSHFDVCIKIKSFGNIKKFCTSKLKTEPFEIYLKRYYSDIKDMFGFKMLKKNVVVYYGFDKIERERIERRIEHLYRLGFKSDYPLMYWKNRTIENIEEIGIERPDTYKMFNHANCIGCLKAGQQHWYTVFVNYPKIWNEAKTAEKILKHSILKTTKGKLFLCELEPVFNEMKKAGIEGNEHFKRFTQLKKKYNLPEIELDTIQCECVI